MYQKKTKSRTKISKEDKLKEAAHKLKRIIEQQRKYIKQLEEQYNIDPLEEYEDLLIAQATKEDKRTLCSKCHKDVTIIPAGIFTVHLCKHCGHRQTTEAKERPE